MKNIFIFFLIFLIGATSTKAQWSIKGETTDKKANWYLLQKFTPEEWDASNFATAKEMEWFNDARYGMFIHFGLSTYIGKDLSWGMCYTRKAPDQGHGPIADSVWTTYPGHFIFDDFNAKRWVGIAQKAGMKYIVVIAKHHDGFHMWDTKFSDFKITNTPFGRDYLKEIADACHEAGMKFGIYYSQRDWYHPDYAPVDTSLIMAQNEPPYYKPKPGITEVRPGPSHQKYIDYQFNVVRELCTNYGKIDVFWFDACWWGGMFTADMWESEKLTRMIRKLQPGIIINNRASIPGDFDTPEQKIGMYQDRPWESCITLCSTWSWSDTPVKSKNTIVKMLSATACGNGNILLSWGPKWEGAFDKAQIKRLKEVGEWLEKYGHSIYNTRGGPWYPEKWGGSTYRANKAFVHITGEHEKLLSLPPIQNAIVSARALTGGQVKLSQDGKGVTLDLREADTNGESVIIEITFKKDVSGMVGIKKHASKFSDVLYGKIISTNASLALSSQSSLDNPEHHKLLFGNTTFESPFAFHTAVEKEPHLLVDLGKIVTVTGLDIYNQKQYTENPGIFEVQISTDGKKWSVVDSHENSFQHWQVEVSKFNAGIQLPGVGARFIKILLKAKNKNALHLKKVLVYGKEKS